MADRVYTFITPSDPITFRAADDAVAFLVALQLGRGKAGCTRDDGVDVQTLLLFMPEQAVEAHIRAQLGTEASAFIAARRADIAAAFASFAYGSVEDRRTYDDAIAAITCPDRLAAFKAAHEDRNRTSMNGWVAYAWRLGEEVARG